MHDLPEKIRTAARTLGFDHVGFASARLDELHHAAYRRWLEGGRHAGMAFMAATREVRLDPRRLLPGAESAIMVARHYAPPATGHGARISAYAAGEDYHHTMKQSLTALAAQFPELAQRSVQTLPFVDTHPVLERALAAAAGIGFIGNNTMLIHPREGSFFLLGGILTDLELPPGALVTENCGTCRACLEACPTEAFPEPFVLDSNRCIGYLTVEHRGKFTEEQARAVGKWVFGCDACQTVCPFNRKVQASDALVNTGIDLKRTLQELAEHPFSRLYGQRAMSRTRRRGLLRNLFAVAVNLRETAVLTTLQHFSDDKDPYVADQARRAYAVLSKS